MAQDNGGEIIFCVNEADVRTLAKETDVPESDLTPEVMRYIKLRIGYEFRHFDSWMTEFVIPNALEKKNK